MTRTCFFPLRTNAGFYREKGAVNLRQRFKEATLLYDHVVLEYGVYSATIGQRISVEFHSDWDASKNEKVRGSRPKGGKFSLAIGKTGSDRRIALAVDEPSERRFASEFQSMISDVVTETDDHLPDWLRIEGYELPLQTKRQIEACAKRDAHRPGFWRRSGSIRLRDRVLYNLEHDLLVAASRGYLASMDGYFGPLARRHPDVVAGGGHIAFRVLVPNFTSLAWPRILELRDHPGVAEFRAKLIELEEECLADLNRNPESGRERILRRVMIDLAERWRPPTAADVAGKIAIDFVLGQVPLVGPAASAAFNIGNALHGGGTWGAFFLHLNDVG